MTKRNIGHMTPERIDIHNIMSDLDGYDDEQLVRMGIDVNIVDIKSKTSKMIKMGEWPDIYNIIDVDSQELWHQYLSCFMDELDI